MLIGCTVKKFPDDLYGSPVWCRPNANRQTDEHLFKTHFWIPEYWGTVFGAVWPLSDRHYFQFIRSICIDFTLFECIVRPPQGSIGLERLETELRRNVSNGLRLAERLLLPDGTQDLSSYSAAMEGVAHHGCCSGWIESSSIAVTCVKCMRSDTSVACLRCFLRQDHRSRRICVHQRPVICECGDPSVILPGSFCPEHRGTGATPDIDLLTPEVGSRILPLFWIAADFGAAQLPNKARDVTLNWFSVFRPDARWRSLQSSSLCRA